MRSRKAASQLGGFEQLHLLTGCCLCGCDICFGPRAIAAGKGKDAFELNDMARELWRRHRNALLLVWRDPEATPSGAGFGAEGRRGAGRWLPCWAECKFEGVKLPKRSAAWPSEIKKLHEHIAGRRPGQRGAGGEPLLAGREGVANLPFRSVPCLATLGAEPVANHSAARTILQHH